MGALTSRQNAGVEEADVVSNHAYKYPPRSGNYFGSHFIMGGERFDTPQPEAYLFGENADLNFLGSRPTPFPYPPPQSNEPTKTLKSLVNIRKESLRFVRCPEPVGKLVESNKISDGVLKTVDSNGKGTYYNIEFTFDCDVKCAITIHYFCTEEVTPSGIVYYPRDSAMSSQTYYYKKGANQQFCQISHVFDPSKHPEEDLVYNADREIIPIAIYCVVDEGQEEIRQSHTTIAVVERHSDGTYVLKALKQKLFVDGLCYLLQEIYGIENKNLDTKVSSDSETEEGGSECVICMCDVRDTLILPCRHLCLCNSCADSLRYQANNCPICRAPFRALLQLRALRRRAPPDDTLPATPPAPPAPPALPAPPAPHASPHADVIRRARARARGRQPVVVVEEPRASRRASGESWTVHVVTFVEGSMENIPAGYEPVSLLEALNGPHCAPPRAPPAIASPDTDTASQAAEILNRCNLERSSSTSLGSAGSRKRDDKRERPAHAVTPEFRMSELLAREEQAKLVEEKTAANSPLLYNHKPLNGENITKSSLSLELPPETRSASVDEEEEAEHTARAEADGDNELGEEDCGGCGDCAPAHDNDLDSDVERLSPLLTHVVNGVASTGGACAATLRHIDDTDTDEPEHRHSSSGVSGGDVTGSDSDYLTPDDSAPPAALAHTLLEAPLSEACPQRWALPHHVTSLPGMTPGTPLSAASVRSSGESYSSGSSTRQLLARAPRPAC